MDDKGELYEVKHIPMHDKNRRRLYNIAVKNWIRKNPTTRWHVDEVTGEIVDLHQMQKVIEERKKAQVVQYPENM